MQQRRGGKGLGRKEKEEDAENQAKKAQNGLAMMGGGKVNVSRGM